jgi:phosphoadenosine phosphosulfate reductase
MRRDQSSERAATPVIGLASRPDNSDVWKLNPLVDWSREQVWAYLKEHHLPHNVLHDRGYRSIGCWPCTQISNSDNERGGRWPGFDKKECGIHTKNIKK